jgi:hypothetical protein
VLCGAKLSNQHRAKIFVHGGLGDCKDTLCWLLALNIVELVS